MDDDEDNNIDNQVANVQHLVWLETLLDDLYECDDIDQLSEYLNHADTYFARLSDQEKSDMFIYAIGFIRRIQAELDGEEE